MALEQGKYNDYIDLTKKYLRNYNKFKAAAEALEKDIQSKEELLAGSLDVGAAVAKYGDMPSGGYSDLNGVEAACERHLEAMEEIRSEKKDLQELKSLLARVETAFRVVDIDVRGIVTDYYVTGYSWEQISYKHHYSSRWCREKSKKAIEDMAMVIFGIKARPKQLSFVFAR